MRSRATLASLGRSAVQVMAVVIVASGCATPATRPMSEAPGAPRILQAEAVPYRAPVGCPVTLRLRFEDTDGDIVRGAADGSVWSGRFLRQESFALALAPEAVAGVRQGEVEIPLTPRRSGRFRYHVQLEDAGGRTSNVVLVEFYRELQPVWAGRPVCNVPGREEREPSAP